MMLSAINNIFFMTSLYILLNYCQVCNIRSSILNCESSFLFKIFVFYKNWDFQVEKEYNSPFDALVDSIDIIQWNEFSQEEKNEFEKVLKSTSHVNCVIRNLVWNFECSILGNSLKVYIVKS